MRIGCLSDSHGNLYALEKALQLIERYNVDMILHLGDALHYIPGLQCFRLLSEKSIPTLKGNHEDMLVRSSVEPSRDDIYKSSLTLSECSTIEREAIQRLPLQMELDSCCFFHAGPNDPLNEYIYPDSDLSIYLPSLPVGAKMCVTGHTHRPFIREYAGVVFVNVGSCGLPRDHGRFGSFAVIDTSSLMACIYRFDITTETERSVMEFGPVHSSVIALSKRLSDVPINGEVIS